MKGRIIKYFTEKGYGFIKDENGDDRFFHISNVKTMDPISVGSLAEFIPDNNTKGLIAVDIKIIEEKMPKFIVLGDVRIKLSNIKNYGLDHITVEKTYTKKTPLTKSEKATQRAIAIPLGIIGVIGATITYGDPLLTMSAVANGCSDTHVEEKKENITYKVLYITTYQGDNYRFSQEDADFDVDDKLAEIDKYFCK
ncbi:cold-shock protein [Clostridium tyrobutyricum]|jgi:cold shock CspA family protein|uniref:cold-shock protein n=1 Tax=Clostridium tyrobutyricum TaxID=1519 RepID=UPI000E9D0032|nr:cold shock domain-containing protein [Clostridium tyrobutyricum]HBF76732.1 hypothetical protein [Clostridiaceae bacterium]